MKKLISGSPVKVISGKHKGKISTITRVDEDRVFLEGVNIAKKAKKGQGYVDVTLPIHISNVMYYDAASSSVSKIGFVIDDKGNKKRVSKKTGKTL